MARVSEKKFIQALVNSKESETNEAISARLGISVPYFYDLRRKYTEAIVIAARELAKNYAIQAIRDLVKQSKQGKTVATTALLEIAKVKEQENLLATPGSWRIQIEKIAPEHVKQVEEAEVKEIK